MSGRRGRRGSRAPGQTPDRGTGDRPGPPSRTSVSSCLHARSSFTQSTGSVVRTVNTPPSKRLPVALSAVRAEREHARHLLEHLDPEAAPGRVWSGRTRATSRPSTTPGRSAGSASCDTSAIPRAPKRPTAGRASTPCASSGSTTGRTVRTVRGVRPVRDSMPSTATACASPAPAVTAGRAM